MTIKRYYAKSDATITDSFKSDLVTRSVSSNTGKSDILEIYSIHGRISSESVERSRVLIEFDLEGLSSDSYPDTARYYLKMFNAEHAEPLPSNYFISIKPVSNTWTEGSGLDLIGYSDEDHTSWVGRSPTRINQVVDVLFNPATPPVDYSSHSITLYDGLGIQYNFYFKVAAEASSGLASGVDVEVDLTDLGGDTVLDRFEEVIAAHNSFSVTNEAGTLRITNVVPGATEEPSIALWAHQSQPPEVTVFTAGGDYTAWVTPGGDYSPLLNENNEEIEFEFEMKEGTEDLEIDITAIVNSWISSDAASLTNYGLGVMLREDFEDGSKAKSFYTKRFFARDSQYFFLRPHIEVRVPSYLKDDSNNLVTSSPHLSGEQNSKTIYYQHLVNGRPAPLAENPSFTLTQDANLVDKVTLPPGEPQNSIISSPGVSFEDNAYVEFEVANTAASAYPAWAKSLITVSYLDPETSNLSEFHFIGRPHNWSAPPLRNDTYAVNVSNTLQNRVAAATAIADEMNAYPGFANLFAAVASGEKVKVYSRNPGNDGKNTSVSIYSVTSSPVDFLKFTVKDFEPFNDQGNEDPEDDTGNQEDSLTSMNQADFDAFRASINSYFGLAMLGGIALPEGQSFNRRTRGALGNAGVTSAAIDATPVTGYVGLYEAKFKIANNISTNTLYKKWWTGTEAEGDLLSGHSGNDPVSVSQWYEKPEESMKQGYSISIPSLQSTYSTDDVAKLRLLIRKRGAFPNIVSKNLGNITSDFIREVHYKIFRIFDNYEVTSYDTLNESTRLSYDKKGNWFMLDMSYLEKGYSYGIKFLIIDGDSRTEHDQIYSFRIE